MEEIIYSNTHCPTFLDSNKIINSVVSKFLKANFKERQYFAQDILLEARVLLFCKNYNSINNDCLNCHSIARHYIQEYKPKVFLFYSTCSKNKKILMSTNVNYRLAIKGDSK